jgi:hypothetical protein
VNALGKLRKMLDTETNMAIHYKLDKINDEEQLMTNSCSHSNVEGRNYEDKNIENVNLYHYIGTIELGAVMVKRGAISLTEFYNQFGYRVENLLNNKEIKTHINEYRSYYEDFIDIVTLLKRNGMLNLDN